MRYFIVIFVIFALSASCHRDDKCCGLQTGILGDWRLIDVQGGIAGIDIRVPADSLVTLSFHPDGSFTTMNGHSLLGSGTYRLTDTPVFSNMSQPVIVFSPGEMTSYSVRPDTLFLGQDFDDGFQKTYVRMN